MGSSCGDSGSVAVALTRSIVLVELGVEAVVVSSVVMAVVAVVAVVVLVPVVAVVIVI